MRLKATIWVFGILTFGSFFEIARADMSNAYHPNQLASGAIATGMDSCQASFHQVRPDITSDFTLFYCSCSIDYYRDHSKNYLEMPTNKKVAKHCADWAKAELAKEGKPIYRTGSARWN